MRYLCLVSVFSAIVNCQFAFVWSGSVVRQQETEQSIAVKDTNRNMSFSHQQDHPPKVYMSLSMCMLHQVFGALHCCRTAVFFGTTCKPEIQMLCGRGNVVPKKTTV